MIARSPAHRGQNQNGAHSGGTGNGTANGSGGGAKENATDPANGTDPAVDLNQSLLRNSLLYREYQAERQEILKHKWIESEKVGHDIGFERALTDWIVRYRSGWRKFRNALRHPELRDDTKKES